MMKSAAYRMPTYIGVFSINNENIGNKLGASTRSIVLGLDIL